MAYVFFNNNPAKVRVGDCVIRAISKVTGKSWEDVYLLLMVEGLNMHDLPTSNNVWGALLYKLGYDRHYIDDTTPNNYTLEQFAQEHKSGSYVVGTGTHAVAVVDGDIYDTWDSRTATPIYYYSKEV